MWEGEYTTKGTAVPIIGADVPAVGADPRRVALIVTADGGGSVVTLKATGVPDDNHRIVVSNTTYNPILAKDVGPLVGYAWSIANAGGALTVYVVEVIHIGKRGG